MKTEGLLTWLGTSWEQAEDEVSEKVWDRYTKTAIQESDEFVLNDENFTEIVI
jgi:hypothetical protein